MFVLDDLSISYPHAAIERVPPLWLFLCSIGIPLATIILFCLFFAVLSRDRKSNRKSNAYGKSLFRGLHTSNYPTLHKIHVSILGLSLSLALTNLLTDVIKNSVGRPRPDLLARCSPKADTPTHALVTIDVCGEPNLHLLHDAWRSFPSGHSSFAFAGLGYLSL
jgi:diacylglycerol diphosphate phosphatase / phosphatidate phosphatase